MHIAKKFMLIAFAALMLPAMTGCSSTAVGAGVGAVGGAVLTGGSAVGTVGGAVVGGVIGHGM